MTTAEAAALHGVSPKTFLRWSETGRIEPAQKLPGLRGHFLWRRSEVEALATDDDPQVAVS